MTDNDIKKVKSEGFLRNRGTENFSARIITENGVVSAKQLKTVCDAAEKFGNGKVSFTTRLTIEVPAIKFGQIEEFKEFIAKSGLYTGGTGPKIRPVVACKGTVCVFGLCDTQALAKEIHNKFYIGYRDVVLPHKFKIAVGGCPNNCVKPDLNDLGIVGQKVVKINREICKKCGKCKPSETCPMKAFIKEDTPKINREICNNCSRCVEACPFKAVETEETVFKIYIGGRWGKKIRMGSPLSKLYSHDELMKLIENCVDVFLTKGEKGERFADTVERLGLDQIEKLLSKQ